MPSNNMCCVPGCGAERGTGYKLHVFPSPKKDLERFNTWVLAIGGDIVNLSNDFIHKYRRVCHAHFEEKYCCRFDRLSNTAVPTLNLPDFRSSSGHTLTVPLLRQRQNLPDNVQPSTSMGLFEGPSAASRVVPDYSEINSVMSTIRKTPVFDENIPSTSKGYIEELYRTAVSQELEKENIDPLANAPGAINLINTAPPKEHFPKKKVKYMPKTIKEQNLYKKILQLRVKLAKFKNKIKKQTASIKMSKKIVSNPEFFKSLEDLPTAARILTVMQFRERKKSDKGRRFTMADKILALSIFKQSPKAYRFLRRILILPAPQTLLKLLQKANLSPGINKNIFRQLRRRVKKLNEQNRLCVLLFDEMALAANITYNERKDKIIGFVDNGEERKPDYADHAQVYMIRGLINNYKQPISYSFSAAATSGPELKKQIKIIINQLQQVGLIVIATICDQGTNNRQAIKLLVNEYHSACLRNGIEPKDNVFVVNDHIIIPLYDTPHLLKCVRNNLLTKHLVYTENKIKIAKWEHLELLHKENPGYRGMRLIPKLSDSHIIPHRIPKMKVKYASQLFSQTVAKNMGYLADKGILPKECGDTADLLMFFDKLFDSLNGSYKKKSNAYAKPLLGPVTEYSIHHKVWQEAKQILKSMKFINRNTGKSESVPTINNWAWTLDNIELMLKKLKSLYGVTSVWMRHLNQDPLENYFGAVRSHGCRNVNPTAEKFEAAFSSLLLNNMSSVHAVGANCEKDYCKNLHALIITHSNEPSTSCDIETIPANIEVIDIKEKMDPRILGPLQYVSGYFVKKAKTKIFKSCPTCNKDLCSNKELEYINRREYAGSQWLCSPSDELVNLVSNLQDIIHTILKENLNKSLLKEFMKTCILIHIDFKIISCDEHREKLIDFLTNLVCRFFIYNHCKNINKILCGKRECSDDEDSYAIKAKKVFSKISKRKK